MSSSTPRRFVIVPARAAYEAEHCQQCPNQHASHIGFGDYEDICNHEGVDAPQVPEQGIPDWCPIKQETHAT